MKRILIVDDDLQNRKHFYANALQSNYVLFFTEDADLLFETIEKYNVDLYLVDMNLDWFEDPTTKGPLSVSRVLEAIGKDKPIIMLSGTYKELADKGRLSKIIQYAAEKGYNVGSFLTWDDIIKAGDEDSKGRREALVSKIEYVISKDRTPYEFGIVCALDEELKPFMDNIDPDTISSVDNDGRYRRSILKTKNGRNLHFISATSPKMGIADTSIIAAEMAIRFNINTIYMVGVCGGREAQKVKIGDVIIPRESVAFHRGKLTNDGFKFEVSIAKAKERGFVEYPEANTVLSELRKAYLDKLLESDEITPSVGKPNVNYGVMACADYVIDKEGELDKIAEQSAQRKICSVDMESFGLYRVSDMLDVKTMVIKSVMDLTNKKSDDYKPYAAFMAANYLYQLLYREVIKFG